VRVDRSSAAVEELEHRLEVVVVVGPAVGVVATTVVVPG
jgi:hypothetical protein